MSRFTVVPVESSNIGSVGHDPESKVLRIWFAKGGIYDYDGVPEELFDRLVNAESVGKTFHAEIKTQFPFQKVA